MPLTAEDKADAVGFLTTNCACWKGKEAVLNGMADDALEVLAADARTSVENALVVNALRTDLKIPAAVTGNAMAEMVKGRMTGPAKPVAADDEEEYVDPKDKKPVPPATNADKVKKMSLRDALQQYGSPDDLEVWEVVLAHNKQAKLQIVQGLVANVADKAERHRVGGELMKKSLPDLELMRRLQPAAPTGNHVAPARFDGQGVDAYTDPTGPTANAGTGRRGDDDLPDVTLGTPVFNWDEIVKETAAAR